MRVEENYVLLVADSLRYDVFLEANTPFLKSHSMVHKAWSHGTYTWPSHQAMMVGHLPHCFEKIPLYNRYIQQLFRLGYGPGTGGGKYQRNPHLALETDTFITDGFKKLGHQTIGTGGATWFAHPIWHSCFDEFSFLKGAERQFQWFFEVWTGAEFFALFNFFETHEPYSYGDVVNQMPENYQEHKLGFGPLSAPDFERLRSNQRLAAEYLDKMISHFVMLLPPRTYVVFTSDHGECFGEDGFFGHGFYHPKVMEVPLLVFKK